VWPKTGGGEDIGLCLWRVEEREEEGSEVGSSSCAIVAVVVVVDVCGSSISLIVSSMFCHR